jgi:hypothetical protein
VVVPAGLPTPLPPPRTALAATFTRLRAADLGRDGLMLERRWQVAIAGDGQPWAWIERRQRPGAGDLPSGLGFDVVDRAPDPR